jgi:fructuronate reductase
VTERLCQAFLSRLPATVRRPLYDRDTVACGIVHIGPGAFHRVHQAWYADRWLAEDPRWGIAAVSLKSRELADALREQDWLYTLAILDERTSFEVVGSLREALVASDSPSVALERLASPATRLVTLTVTEKGYCLDGAGRLDMAHPDVRHDLVDPAQPRSAIGWVVAGLRLRCQRRLPAIPVMSCDNLAGNGRLLAAAVKALAAEHDPGLAQWIAAEVPFPCTMVDSITPATTPELVHRVAAATGLDDRWPVQREGYVQWVVEQHRATESPDWERAGVVVTSDVSGYEQAKLRLLNGAHSTLAYVGLLRGHETVADAMRDVALAAFVRDLMREDVAATLPSVGGLDVDNYIEAVLRRFSNPAIRHELAQIAWDGSKKLPVRILGTVRDALALGRAIDRLCVTLAAWMHFVRRRTGEGIALVDPLAERLSRLARDKTTGNALTDVVAFLELEEVFPRDLATDPRFDAALARAYERLARGRMTLPT